MRYAYSINVCLLFQTLLCSTRSAVSACSTSVTFALITARVLLVAFASLRLLLCFLRFSQHCFDSGLHHVQLVLQCCGGALAFRQLLECLRDGSASALPPTRLCHRLDSAIPSQDQQHLQYHLQKPQVFQAPSLLVEVVSEVHSLADRCNTMPPGI